MLMCKKNLKLIATAIGLVAVLVMGLAMPGATQRDALTRENLIQLINRVYAPTLTASEGIIWDTQCVSFYSSPFITFSFIPANPYSRSIERIRSGDFDNVPLFLSCTSMTMEEVSQQLNDKSYRALTWQN
jgi:hypothetical protein